MLQNWNDKTWAFCSLSTDNWPEKHPCATHNRVLGHAPKKIDVKNTHLSFIIAIEGIYDELKQAAMEKQGRCIIYIL